MSRNTRLYKINMYTPFGYDNTFKLLAFHTFLNRQTNLKSTSSVLSVNQPYYEVLFKAFVVVFYQI